MKKRILSLFVASAMVFSLGGNILTVFAADSATVVRLDPSNASPFNDGKFEGWGTSMGWWGNRIGYDDTLSKKAAELFYNEETGLGLDIVRYNVGGGDHPEHNHITRSDSKLPCFAVPELNADNTPKKDANGKFVYDYNWDNDHNQVNVLKEIKKQNDEVHIEGYTNSPPWFMTNSLCSSGGDETAENLDPENYDDFAEFIVDVTKKFDEWGLTFDSYSPMNEPNLATNYWRAYSYKQEGNHVAQGEHQAGLIKAIKDAYKATNIDTLVAGPDETNINYTVSGVNAIKNIDGAVNLDRIDTHTYSGSQRTQLKDLALSLNKNLWMSEVDGGWNGFGLADRIITDLNGMQASAWVMWDIVDMHKDSTSDMRVSGEANASLNKAGTLWGVSMANHDTKEIELANKYYFYGQFTRYINPGDTLIASSNSTLAAYNKETGDIKIVALNSGGTDKPYIFDLGAFTNVGDAVQVIRTNNETEENIERWAEISDGATLADRKLTTTLKAGTVTTFVIEGDETADTSYISVNGADRIALGGEATYTVSSDIANAEATWSTSDSSVATIDADGKLTALKKGSVSVIATVGAKTGTKEVEVYFEITGAGDKIKLGNEVQLSAGDLEGVTWQSSDTSVATISETGVVKAVAPGEFMVTATYGTDTATKTFVVPSYILTGTPSWGDNSTLPKDSDDYTKVADGNLSTFFDGTTGGWVQYDFGAPYNVSKIKLAARSGDKMAARTVGGRVQGSSDAINWTDLYKVTSALSATSYKEIAASELTNLKAYRYYRYTNTENMANISEFLIEGEPSADGTPAGEPVVTAIDEFTDDFESSLNIFNAKQSDTYNTTGNTVFPSGLARFSKVFAPIKDTAKSTLPEPLALTDKDIFRLSFNMFAGWEQDGVDNTFSIKDEGGNELVAIYLTGGGYTLQEIRIGGENVLSGTGVAQSRSNANSSKENQRGANGWDHSSQPYRNNAGNNKTVEITIDGLGQVKVNFAGGMAETTASGKLLSDITIGSIEATGNYKAAAGRTVTYDNFVGDLITYVEALEEEPEPVPSDPPVLPQSNELIHLKFDNNLDSTSSYGKAEGVGTPAYETLDGRTALKLSNNNNSAIKLTDANGNSLLTGQEEITIAFKVKPTSSDTSWWFYAAPNDTAQTVNQEKYIGAFTNGGNIKVERYSNSGTRSTAAEGECAANQWNNVVIQHKSNETIVYVNGQEVSTVASTVNISNMLGNSSVAYIGKANWGSGEYATGYIDDFVIYKGIVDVSGLYLGDLSAVKTDIELPTSLDDGSTVSWVSSNTDIISNTGKVTRPDLTTDVTLTATVTPENDDPYTSQFTATVIGLTVAADAFTAYNDNGDIKYTSGYDADDTPYDMYIALHTSDGTLVSVTKNQKDGTFEELEEGTYKVSCYIWGDKNEPKHDVVTKTVKAAKETQMGAYLFAHFVGNEENADVEQVYFTVSNNGTTWQTLNGGNPVLKSAVGQNGVRDPYIIRGENGKFFIIATDLSIYNLGLTEGSNKWSVSQRNGSKNIVVWESDSISDWSGSIPNLREVAVSEAGCTWAPEAIYDSEEGKYMVFWASMVDGKQRVYRSYTADFVTFDEPEIYIERDYSVIDTTFIQDKGIYYRFTKNEQDKFIFMESSTSLDGPWTEVSGYNQKESGYEGPTIFKMNNEGWCLMLDKNNHGGYKPFITTNLSQGVFTKANDVNFNTSYEYRHGTVIPITTEEYTALLAKYPVSSN